MKSKHRTKLVPKLRFKEFDSEWVKTKLQETVRINQKNGELPQSFVYIDLESVSKGRLLIEKRIKKETAPSRAQRNVKKEDILFQTVRPYQKNNFYFDKNGDYIASTGYAVLSTKKENSSKYIYQIIHTEKFVTDVLKRCTGTSYPAINTDDLKTIPIAKPSLPEQQKIASFLTAVDKRIEQLTKKKKLLEEYKKGVMQKIFPAKGSQVPEIRFKGFEGEWKMSTIGDVLIIGSGRDYKHLNAGNVPVYGTGGCMALVDDYLYDGDSVGIGRKGTIDKPMFLRGKFWTVDTLFYTHNFKDITPSFTFQIFQAINWQLYNEASGVPSLSKSTIEKIKIKVPTLTEQQRITSILTSLDKCLEQCDGKIDATKVFKTGLLQQMFV